MNKERKNLLVFGYGLCILLTFFGVRLGVKHGFGWFNYCLFTLAGISFLLTATFSPYLKVIYTQWMKVAGLIGHCVTTVILTIFYFVVFTPARFFLWCSKKDFMNLKNVKEKPTAWNFRTQRPFERANYTKQY